MEHPDEPTLPLITDLALLLTTEAFGRTIRGFATVPSTNALAGSWARSGAPEGSVVVAEYQSRGRGRLGRTWEAEPGVNLTFSVVLRPRLRPDRLGLITLAASVAVAEAVQAFVHPLRPTIKWPNDLLLGGRKCAGMLLESTLASPAGPAVVVLGIGLNVNQVRFPPELAERATSLCLETHRPLPRPHLLAALLARLEAWYRAMDEDDGAAVRRAYTAWMSGIGDAVTLRYAEAENALAGRLLGIDESGALRLEVGLEVRTFHAGEVTFR